MALFIDSTLLAQISTHAVQEDLDRIAGQPGRYVIYRVCARATVIHGLPSVQYFLNSRADMFPMATQEALDWQADQDDELDEMEVLHHLKQQAKTSPMLDGVLSGTGPSSRSTSIFTTVAIPGPSVSASACAQGRPISGFHRYSIRYSGLSTLNPHFTALSTLGNILPSQPGTWPLWWLNSLGLQLLGPNSEDYKSQTVWQVQLDFVDLLSLTSPSEKRLRTRVNPFHRVPSTAPEQDVPPQGDIPEEKRFNGVRYRADRARKWTAQMKLGSRRTWIGEFESQEQAARAADAGFHYYGQQKHLNFLDTPQNLPPLRSGLNDEDKLKFVKAEANRLAAIVHTLPSSSTTPVAPSDLPESSMRNRPGPSSLHFDAPESSTRVRFGASSRTVVRSDTPESSTIGRVEDSATHSSYSEITTFPSYRAGGDGISQHRPMMRPGLAWGNGGDGISQHRPMMRPGLACGAGGDEISQHRPPMRPGLACEAGGNGISQRRPMMRPGFAVDWESITIGPDASNAPFETVDEGQQGTLTWNVDALLTDPRSLPALGSPNCLWPNTDGCDGASPSSSIPAPTTLEMPSRSESPEFVLPDLASSRVPVPTNLQNSALLPSHCENPGVVWLYAPSRTVPAVTNTQNLALPAHNESPGFMWPNAPSSMVPALENLQNSALPSQYESSGVDWPISPSGTFQTLASLQISPQPPNSWESPGRIVWPSSPPLPPLSPLNSTPASPSQYSTFEDTPISSEQQNFTHEWPFN